MPQKPAVAAGERFDRDAGLQYLNARYYDPELGRFIQPDWRQAQVALIPRSRTVSRHPARTFAPPVLVLQPWSDRGISLPPIPRKSCQP
ncbi:MAG: hypothetical protein GXP03_02680 [Alphaproteobacteria bacterium]|nr:hypothetical protein [Alphaproteobacteria bacterium]